MTTTATTIEHRIGAEGLFVLQLASGAVRVQGADGDAVTVTEEHGLDLEESFDIERGDGSLAVRTRKGFQFQLGSSRDRGRRHGRSAELDVRVPRRATLVIEANSADLTGDDLAGDQRFHTASGDIELRRVSGTVAIEAVSGDVALTATGDLRLQARTVSGDLAIRAGRLLAVEAATTSGDVALAGELEPAGSHRVETVSGDTLLALAGGVRVEVSTVTGDVSADVPHRTERVDGGRVVIVGDGRATLVARSMSGDVRIGRVRAHDIPVPPEAVAPAPPSAPMPVEPPAAPVVPSSPSDAAIAAAYDDARLAILRSLERGEIDVVEAGRRLETLDAADVPEGVSRG